jgi:peptide/nickel transport system substrate-binding protein
MKFIFRSDRLLLSLVFCNSTFAVDYKEAPQIAARVAAGELPPVEERLPVEPLVVKIGSYGVDSIGRYGGVIRKDALDSPSVQGATDITVPFYNDLLDGGAFLPLGWKAYEFSDNARTWTFSLRRGMKWSDGHPYTVDDVLFWYEDFVLNNELSPVPPSWLTHGGELPKIEKIDHHTVRFTFQAPNLNFPRIMSWFSERQFMAFPKHYLAQFHPKHTDPEALKRRAREAGFSSWSQLFEARRDWLYNSNPDLPTLCPWVIRSGIPNNPAIYIRNPYYYAVDEAGNQLPYADEVRWTLVGNADRMKMRIMAGSVSFQRVKDLESAELFAEAREKGAVELGMVKPWQNYNGHTVVMNLVTPDLFKAKLFNDKRFRHALSLQMPREEIAEILYSGMVNPKQIGITDPSHEWYVERLANAFLDYDPDKANRLLDEVGLEKKNNAGLRLGSNGKPLQLNVTTLNAPRLEKASEIVCEQMAEVGIKANFRVAGWDRLEDMLREAKWEIFLFEDVMNHSFLWPSGMEGVRASRWNAYPWYRWLLSGGEDGTEPPESMKTSWDWWQKARVAPTKEALKESISWLQANAADELLAIGLTSFTPQIRIRDPKIKNVPFADPWFLYSAAYFEP